MADKPKGRIPRSTRAGGTLFDREKYNRHEKYEETFDFAVCRACGQVRERSDMINMGREGWCCKEC